MPTATSTFSITTLPFLYNTKRAAMRNFKIYCLILTIGCFLTLSGCPKKETGKKVINYWDSMPPTEPVGMAIRSLMKEFEEKNPSIKIKYQYITWGELNTKLQASIVGGNPPDVVLLDRFVTGSYAFREALTPLDSYIQKDGIKSKDFWPACWNEVVYDGKVWAIPHHTDARALYYRVDDFKEVGLDPDKPPKTWDELFEYAKKLTKRDEKGRILRIGFLPYYGNTWLYLWGWLNGGEFMIDNKPTVNDPKIVEALDWTIKFEDYYGGAGAIDVTVSGYGSKEMDPFIMGKLSMRIDGDWYISVLEKFGPKVEYRIAPPPAPAGRKSLTWSGGFAYCIPKGAKNPEEAWQFIKFMVSKESQLKCGKMSSRIPALIEVSKDPFYVTHPKYKVFIDLMKVSRYRPVSPIANIIWDELDKATQYARLKKKTPKQALDDANEKIKIELEKISQK